jgi:hypothetical protein
MLSHGLRRKENRKEMKRKKEEGRKIGKTIKK